MHAAIEILMREHRQIEEVLASLETFVNRVHAEADATPATIARYARFFRGFADRWHHGKEEDHLFVKMGEYGFSPDFGPVAVMLSEHVQGRNHVSELVALGEKEAPLECDDRQSFMENSVGYINLLRAHIQKEDDILYPMALQAIPSEELDRLVEAYQTFERETGDEGAPESYHALAEGLLKEYPPAS